MIESASTLFHRNGLTATSLADIAKHADIPIGNVYYYFKTKEELALAVVEKHREQYRAAYELLNDNIDDPRMRLIEATKAFNKSRDDYALYGCPIGRIISDGDMQHDNVSKAAAQVLTEFVDWAAEQFIKLGHDDTAKQQAASLVAGIQGGIVMGKALQNPHVISDEIARLVTWLESVPNRKIRIGKMGLKF